MTPSTLRIAVHFPNSRVEARRLRQCCPKSGGGWLLDYDATRQAVLDTDWRSTGRPLCRVHSLIDLQRPEPSGIVLAPYDRRAARRTGFLRL